MKRILTLTCSLLLTIVIYSQNNEELWKQYQQGEYAKVIEQVLPLIKKSPDDITLKLLLGRAYADNQQYNEALPFLEDAKTMDKSNGWIKSWSLAYLGVCYFRLSDNVKSKDCLKQSIELNATKNVNNFASRRLAIFGFTDIYNDFRVIEKEHIVFHFQPKSIDKIGDIEKYMTVRELAFDSLSHFFLVKIPRKIDFFVWESNEDAIKTLNAPIGFSNPEMCIIHINYNQTVGHELTHVVSNHLNNMEAKTRLVNEGTAVYFDMTGRNRIKLAKEALQNGDTVNIKEMWRNPSMPERYFNPIAGAFMEYLIQTGGKDKFLRLCINQSLGNAEQIYSPNLDSIIQTFERKFADTRSVAERDSIRVKNIRIIDTAIDKVILAGKSGKKPLIVLNMEEYTYDDYQLQKHNLKVLTKATVNNISLLKDQSAEVMSKIFKHSISDGIYLITIGEMKLDNPFEKEE